MRNRLGQKTLSLSLSALVLAWGSALPGVWHAHPGGRDSTHRHDQGRELAHYGSHNHDSGGDYRACAIVPDVSLLADFVAHLHWQWLGIDFSVPIQDEPSDGSHGDTVPPAIVRAINEIVPAIQTAPSFGRVLLAVVGAPSADVVSNLTPILRPPNLITSIPLCDAARFERSGVLLA